jgi:hypothetical protein
VRLLRCVCSTLFVGLVGCLPPKQAHKRCIERGPTQFGNFGNSSAENFSAVPGESHSCRPAAATRRRHFLNFAFAHFSPLLAVAMADSASHAAQRPSASNVGRSYLLIACEDDASSRRAVTAPASAARSREPPLAAAAAAADAGRASSAHGRDHAGASDEAPSRIPLKTIPSYRVFTSATGAAPRVIVSRAQAQVRRLILQALAPVTCTSRQLIPAYEFVVFLYSFHIDPILYMR